MNTLIFNIVNVLSGGMEEISSFVARALLELLLVSLQSACPDRQDALGTGVPDKESRAQRRSANEARRHQHNRQDEVLLPPARPPPCARPGAFAL